MRAKSRMQVVRAILMQFVPRFIPRGRVVWVSVHGGATSCIAPRRIAGLKFPPALPEVLPNVIIHDRTRRWLVLIDVASGRGRMNTQRCERLLSLFRGSRLILVFVSAFWERSEFRGLGNDFAWGIAAWFASEPDHMIHFNGGILQTPQDSRDHSGRGGEVFRRSRNAGT